MSAAGRAATAEHGSPPVPAPRSAFGRLVVGMNAIGSVWILGLVLLVTCDALSRSFFAHPIAGVTEMVQISILGIVFLQLADAIRRGKLTRSDSFLSLLRKRYPAATDAIEGLFCVLGAVYMALALWGTLPLLTEAFERDFYLGNQGVFTVIVWPIKAVTVLGLGVCLIEFSRQAWQALRQVGRC